MDILKKNFLIFIHAKRIIIVFALEMLLILVVLISQAYNYTITNDSMWYLHKVQSMCAVMFIINLYISYEYIHSMHTCGIEEAIQSYNGGKLKLYGYGLAVMLCLSFFEFLFMTLFSIVIALIGSTPAVIYPHILSVSVLNTLLPCILAGLIGFLFALKLKRIKAYALMALIVFVMTPASDLIPGILNDGYHINIWPVKAVFSDILPPNLTWTMDYQYGVSSEFFRWNIMLFWMLFIVTVLIFSLFKAKRRILGASLCLILAFINLFYYSFGSSKIDLSLAPTSVFRTDQVYYRHHEPKEEKAQFEIASYGMKLNVDRKLNAEVTMELNAPSDLDEYKFTLYNWYKLSSVKDENGSDLDYVQDGDYIIVNAEKPMKSISMSYSGYSPMFYSNERGVCLPGCFPYYPWAGYRKIYYSTPNPKEGLAAFIPRTDLPESDFSVEINGEKNMYTNLNEENGTLRGTTNALSIIGGFLKEKKFGDYNTIVCDFGYSDSYISEAYLDSLQNEITKIEKEKNAETHFDLKKYKIFQASETIGRAGYGPVICLDDHIFVMAPDVKYSAKKIISMVEDEPPLTIGEYKKTEEALWNRGD